MEFDERTAAMTPLPALDAPVRIAGFEAVFDDKSGLAAARAEAQYRQQFERLVEEIRTH